VFARNPLAFSNYTFRGVLSAGSIGRTQFAPTNYGDSLRLACECHAIRTALGRWDSVPMPTT